MKLKNKLWNLKLWWNVKKLHLECKLWKLRGLARCKEHGFCEQSWITGECKLCKHERFRKIYRKECVICGKGFGVKVRPDGFIETDCFHNTLDLNYFDGWMYRLLDRKKKDDELSLKRIYKNKFYKIIGFCGLTRWIVYNLWNIFHKKAKFEFWECTKCANRPDDI